MALEAFSKEDSSSAPDEEEKRAEKMVEDDLTRLWDATDLCRSDDAIFAASGVCDGYLPGVIVGEDSVQTFAELIDVKLVKLLDTIEPIHCDTMAIQLRIEVRLPEGHWSGDVSRKT